MSHLMEVDDQTFGTYVVQANVLVAVAFMANWSGSCRLIKPALEACADEFEKRAIVAALDVDSNQMTQHQFGVTSLPTVLFFRNGRLVDRIVGAVPKAALETRINTNLAAPV
jgi:thioredoxin 1